MALFFHGASRFPECVKIPRRGLNPRRGKFCAHFPDGGRIRRLFSRRACILLSNESEEGDGVKQLRFVILIMLIMLLLCPAARAAQTPGSANTEQM